ncbi:hypothetical protein LCGC14_0368320 [marine sediment metagenome]|uniref:Uncharacterized protein n=1 Tax=marine sediment metagenome TaxID=412755 RepID=A0A0F9T5W6_9ZZZZ
MVIRDRNKSMITFVPECTCNKKLNYVKWKCSRFDDHKLIELNSYAEDHEELHTLSRKIVDFIAETGKMEKEDILANFPDFKEGQIQMAANLGMYPIIFPKRRRAPPAEFERLKQHARRLTEEYRRAKYASDVEEEPPLIE